MQKLNVSSRKKFIFLKEIFLLGISAFGGPQAHISMFFKNLVEDKKYLSEEDLLELNALCSILPGPTSTQTITAIGFRMGGAKLAYLTLLVWALPAVSIMTLLGIMIASFQAKDTSLDFTKFIQPMAVGFVAFAAWKISRKVIKTRLAFIILVFATIASFFAASPYAFPIILLVGGFITALFRHETSSEEHNPLSIRWENFYLWIGILVFMALVGFFTKGTWVSKPILIFENFYRNGSLIFGGGQVLIPLLLTEFSIEKHYLTEEEFRIGFAFMQALPGPLFSFSAYIGAMSLKEYGVMGQILGGLMASLGIFLPGTFLIFFVIRIWNRLKSYALIKASLEGINGAASGMVIAATLTLYFPVSTTITDNLIMLVTFLLLQFTRIYAPVIVLSGIALGFLF